MSEGNGKAYGNKISRLFDDFSERIVHEVQAEIKELHKIPETLAVTNQKLDTVAESLKSMNRTLSEIKDKGLNLIYLIVIGAFLLSGVKGLGEFFK